MSVKNINCSIITDKRGYKYFENYNGKIYIISSSNLNGNLIFKIFGIFQILLGLIQSFIIIFLLKPSHSISFGSYASFAPLLCFLLFKYFFKTSLYLHEQNSVVGKVNKIFLKFSSKIFMNFDKEYQNIDKYQNKVSVVGLPQRIKEDNSINIENKKTSIINFLLFAGSQGSIDLLEIFK